MRAVFRDEEGVYWSPSRDFGLVVRALPLPGVVTKWLNDNKVIVFVAVEVVMTRMMMMIDSGNITTTTTTTTTTITSTTTIYNTSQHHLHAALETSTETDQPLLLRLQSVINPNLCNPNLFQFFNQSSGAETNIRRSWR
jgi:hypothetical protein